MKIQWPIQIKENKYTVWYELLMEKAKNRPTLEGYKERHHIVPNCFVKNNSQENLVYLTAREHYIAHLLLWKMSMPVKWHNKMTMALNVMVNGSGHKKQDRSYLVHSRIYEAHRKDYARYLSEYMSGDGNKFRGKKHSPETIQKIIEANERTNDTRSAKLKGINNPMYGKTHSDEMKKQIANSVTASWTDEKRKEQSIRASEKWKDPSWKEKVLEKRKNNPNYLNKDYAAIGRKAADTKKANGWKPSEESKRKLSETRKAKFKSGELVVWNKGRKKGNYE
jgi:hypothetical protein